MLALHVGLRRAAAPAAIVGYSGLLVVPPDADFGAADDRGKFFDPQNNSLVALYQARLILQTD